MSSLDKALQILRCYSAERLTLGVSEVAADLELPKSSVSRLMKAMAEAKLLEPSREGRGYSPGPLAFRLGNLYFKDDMLLDLVEQASEQLVAEFGLTSYLGALEGTDCVLVGVRQGSYPVRLVLPKGMHLPAHVTAVGLSLLARLPDDEILRRYPKPVTYSETGRVNTGEEIVALARKARTDRFAEAEGVTYRGFSAIAVAVANMEGGHMFSFSLSCPQELFTTDMRARMRSRMTEEARNIGLSMGDPYWLKEPPSNTPPSNSKKSKPREKQPGCSPHKPDRHEWDGKLQSGSIGEET